MERDNRRLMSHKPHTPIKIIDKLSVTPGELPGTTAGIAMKMDRFTKVNEDQRIIDNVNKLRGTPGLDYKKLHDKRISPRSLLKGNLNVNSDIAGRIRCISHRSEMKSTRKYITALIDNMKQIKEKPMKEIIAEERTVSETPSTKCFFGRCKTLSTFRKLSEDSIKTESEGDDDKVEPLPKHSGFKRLATIKADLGQRKLFRRQSTQRVKFEDFTESHFSVAHKRSLSSQDPPKVKLTREQIKETELRRKVLMKIKEHKQNLRNPFSSMYDKASPATMFKNVTQKNLLSYVRKMQVKLTKGELDDQLSNQKVNSKRMANNIICMREKFSISGNDTEGPTRKIISVDSDMRFAFKRRSVDYITTTELKHKLEEGRLVKALGGNILEMGHQDFQIKSPANKEIKPFTIASNGIKLSHLPNVNLVRPHHFDTKNIKVVL